MNIHNPALAAQIAAVKAARARMGINPYSPRVFVRPPPPVVEIIEPQAPEPKPLVFKKHEIIKNQALEVIALRQKSKPIIDAAAVYYGVEILELLSSRRTLRIVIPRQVAMFVCAEYTPLSLPEIGRRFGGRDHTTVLHAHRKIKQLIADGDAEIISAVEKIRHAAGLSE